MLKPCWSQNDPRCALRPKFSEALHYVGESHPRQALFAAELREHPPSACILGVDRLSPNEPACTPLR
jgi:hypothetical protein